MKKTILLVAMLSTQLAWSQENDGKRPSWSQGLPERHKTAAPNMKNQIPTMEDGLGADLDLGMSRTDIEFEGLSKPVVIKPENKKIDAVEPIEPVHSPVVEFDTEAVLQAPSTATSTSHQKSNVNMQSNVLVQQKEKVQAPVDENAASYLWHVERMVPVQVPKSLAAQHHSVLLKLSIDSQGKVIDVSPVIDQTSPTVMRHAIRYVNQWRFEPPRKQGINHELSRVFNVSIQARG